MCPNQSESCFLLSSTLYQKVVKTLEGKWTQKGPRQFIFFVVFARYEELSTLGNLYI